MKKIFLLLSLFSFFGFLGHAQEKGKLEFSSKVIDFGELREGANAERSLSFKNTGGKPVKIKRISSTGHVSVEDYPQNAVQPGNSGNIKISYNTDKIGPIRRTLTVYSNAQNSFESIKIKGIVKKD